MVISIERYWNVMKPNNSKPLTFKLCFKIIGATIAFCLLWSAFPLMGWSHYNVETTNLYCSIEFNEKSFNVISFTFACVIIFLLFPMAVILYTNIKLYKLVIFLTI